MRKPPKHLRKFIEDELNEQLRWLHANAPPDVLGPFDYQFDHPIAGWSLSLYERRR